LIAGVRSEEEVGGQLLSLHPLPFSGVRQQWELPLKLPQLSSSMSLSCLGQHDQESSLIPMLLLLLLLLPLRHCCY